MKRTKELAHYEIGWWKAHHRKDKEKFVDSMCRLYSLQFDIDYMTKRNKPFCLE